MLRARSKGITVALFFYVLLATTRPGFGQVITGDILGTVEDSSGALVPGAKITLTSVNTGIKWESTSDPSGDYLFAELKPGHYSLQVSKEGFQTHITADIELLVGQRPRVDVTLQLGAVAQKVEVSAGGVQLLETQTATESQVITEKIVTELPLNGRNFVSLMLVAPGVAPLLNGASNASFWTGQTMVSNSVSGLRESNESFLVDGVESREVRFGAVGLRPSVDAIQEFSVQTSNFSAEWGRSSVVINTTLKSGSNSIHGTMFEFVENNTLNANNFFNNLSATPNPAFKQNDFGMSFGGPVVIPHLYQGHDKTFFFINYEGIRSRQGAANTGVVPSTLQLQGDLADDSAGTGLYPTSSPFCAANPGSVKCVNVIDPTTGQPFPGNVIPTKRLSPFVAKWAPFWVAPNVAVTPGQAAPPVYNVINSPMVRNDMNQGNARMDHALSSKDNIFGSFSFEDRPHVLPGLMPTQGLDYPYRNELLSVVEDYVFSPNVVNEIRFGYNRDKSYILSLGADHTNYAVTAFGLTNTSLNPFDAGVPLANITGFSTAANAAGVPAGSGPGSFSESCGALDQDYQIVDNLSIVSGTHNVKLGMNFIHEKYFDITDFAGVPTFNFGGTFTGNGLGDYLLGDPYSASASVGDSHQNLRSNYYAGFIQDDWRMKPGLTLNIGFRYEHRQEPYDTQNRTEWFDPRALNPATDTLGYVVNSQSGAVRNGVVDPDWHDFAPRFGFAYSPKFLKNTVVRSSYGIFWASDVWNQLQFLVEGPPFYSSQTITSNPVTPTIDMSQMFPAYSLAGAGTSSPFTLSKRERDPYVQEWTFDVQHTFAKNFLFDVAYVGNVGQKLRQTADQNYRLSYDPTGTIPYQDAVPYPAYSFILTGFARGWSDYHALQTKLEKRLSNGMTLLALYTYSHAIDFGYGDNGAFSGIRSEELGNSDYDARQRFVLSYTYELPMGRGKYLASGASGPINKVIGGWKLNGITTFQTGQYVSVSLPLNWANNGTWGVNRPMRIGNPVPSHRSYSNWWNENAFEYPGCTPAYNSDPLSCPTPLHIVGDSGQNQYEIPGVNNWDFAVMKDTPIKENFTAQFRAEFFNGWNHTQFGTPYATMGITFGHVSTTLEPPRVVQFALKFIF
jgi:hypothetical protein